MNRNRRIPTIFCSLLLAVLASEINAQGRPSQATQAIPHWIWNADAKAGSIPVEACFFRRSVNLESGTNVSIAIAANDTFDLFFNGRRVGHSEQPGPMVQYDLTQFVRAGKNTIAVKVVNLEDGNAGLAAIVSLKNGQQPASYIVTDGTWRATRKPLPLWNRRNYYSEAKWKFAQALQRYALTAANATAAKQSTNLGNPSNPIATPSAQPAPQHAATATAQSGKVQKNTKPTARASTKTPSSWKIGQETLKTPDIQAPKEFEVQHVAGGSHLGSVIAFAFNEFGRIVASQEKGSLVLIYDSNQDNSFDTIRECCRDVTNVQGILPLNGQLFVTGKGKQGVGLYRLADDDNDGFYEAVTNLVKFKGGHGEHGPHGLSLGPDGYIYLVLGNHASVDGEVTDDAPYQNWYEGDLVPRYEDPGGHAAGIRAPGATILRVDVEGKDVEIFAGGLRNPYDIAFDATGQLFTHDSDMESDQETTWYRSTRVFHVVPGGEYGWRSGWAKWPDYYHDSLPHVTDTKRGSPTGLIFYDHFAYPKRYRNTLFSCDWTSGKILVMRCEEDGASYKATPVAFVRGKPLNATDIEVGSDGWLYFSTGGRGTQGNIYRVVWQGKSPSVEEAVGVGINSVLRQPQFSSAWARQKIAATQAELGYRWKTELIGAVNDKSRAPNERARALDVMKLFGPSPSPQLLESLSKDKSKIVRIAAVRYLALADEEAGRNRLLTMLDDSDPQVRRTVCESLIRLNQSISVSRIEKMLASSDRFESLLARRLLEKTEAEIWKKDVLTHENVRVFLQGATALMVTSPSRENAKLVLERGQQVMQSFINDRDFADLLRLFQITLHRSSLTHEEVPKLRQLLAEEYPSAHDILNRELVRLLVYLQVDEIMNRYFSELNRGDLAAPEKLHLATHLTFLRNGWDKEQKFRLFSHLDSPTGAGDSVPGYLQNIVKDFGTRFTAEEQQFALKNGDRYPSAALAVVMNKGESLDLAEIQELQILDAQLTDTNDEAVKRLKIVIVAILARDGSDLALDYLRKLYETDESRRVEVAYGLSESPTLENWPYLVKSLPLLDPQAAHLIIVKLKEVTHFPKDSEPYRIVIRTADRLGDQRANDAVALLEHWRGFAPSNGKVPWRSALTAWKRWYAEQFPESSLESVADQSGSSGKSTTGARQLLSKLNDGLAQADKLEKRNGRWQYDELLAYILTSQQGGAGSTTKGRNAYVKADCAKCHRRGGLGDHMGPSLDGLASRYSTKDILDSIVFPSKVVSDQYASKTVITSQGKTHVGIIAGGSQGEIAILTSNGQKIRIHEDDVEDIVANDQSSMPDGLLDRLTVDEIVDLFAFLTEDAKSLTTRPTVRQR